MVVEACPPQAGKATRFSPSVFYYCARGRLPHNSGEKLGKLRNCCLPMDCPNLMRRRMKGGVPGPQAKYRERRQTQALRLVATHGEAVDFGDQDLDDG